MYKYLVLLTRASNCVLVADDVYLARRMLEAEEASGNDRDKVVAVIDAREVSDCGVEEVGECGVANARRAISDTLHGCRGQVKLEHERIELRNSAAERVANLISVSMVQSETNRRQTYQRYAVHAVCRHEALNLLEDQTRGLLLDVGEAFVRLHTAGHTREQSRVQGGHGNVYVCEVGLAATRVSEINSR